MQQKNSEPNVLFLTGKKNYFLFHFLKVSFPHFLSFYIFSSKKFKNVRIWRKTLTNIPISKAFKRRKIILMKQNFPFRIFFKNDIFIKTKAIFGILKKFQWKKCSLSSALSFSISSDPESAKMFKEERQIFKIN